MTCTFLPPIQINFLLIAAVIVNVSGFGGFGLGLIGKSAKPVCCPCPVDSDQSDAGASSAKTNAQRPIRDGLKKVVPVIKEMAPAFIEMAPGIVSIVSASSKLTFTSTLHLTMFYNIF